MSALPIGISVPVVSDKFEASSYGTRDLGIPKLALQRHRRHALQAGAKADPAPPAPAPSSDDDAQKKKKKQAEVLIGIGAGLLALTVALAIAATVSAKKEAATSSPSIYA